MKKFTLFIWLFIFCFQSTQGQSKDNRSQFISLDTVNLNSLYKYQNFIKGKVIFRDGGSSTARLNINVLVNEIQFIDQKGDTLSIADPKIINNVLIGEDEYIYKDGVIEVLKGFAHIKLGITEKYDLKFKDQHGFYGESIDTYASAKPGTFFFLNNLITVSENKNMIIASKAYEFYFIEKRNNIIVPATKRNLFQVYKEHNEKALSGYLNEHNVNFKSEEDLSKLLLFCEQFIGCK